MRFSITTLLASLAALASANTVQFISQDSTSRTIIFTAQEGLPEIPSLQLPGLSQETVTFPTGWIGNFYSVSEGAPPVPGMLGELRWDGYQGLTFFDISAIVNPNDLDGVKTLYPAGSQVPTSGCQSYVGGCAHAYYLPDDVQTQATPETDLICTVGNLPGTVGRRHPRDFVTGNGPAQ